ncbi:MAG: tRNA (adenosine(37)-N6)-threonylcarbamoyltransferase complex dimerization subunit type 1 TsaB [Planctomycetota bacterium]|jgi:tRNA threonylcarbamoyladenosine biosynthesis protein TsaB
MAEDPLILAAETSGRTGSVAIAAGEQLLGETTFSRSMRHSSEIFPAACALLDDAQRKHKEVEHVYISVGPGSFTGLRIAVTLAKLMHLANGAKIVAVDTLDVIASNVTDYLRQESMDIHRIAAILDAKRSQFFVAAYEACSSKNNNTRYERILPDCLMTAPQFLEQFASKPEPIWLLGEGLLYHKESLEYEGVGFLPEECWSPHASKVHQLGWEKALAGQFADPLTLQPTYIRRPEAEEKWKQRKVP